MRSFFVSWETLAEQLRPTYFVPSTKTLHEESLKCASRWIDVFEVQGKINLTDVEIDEIREAFSQLALEHWSIKSIVSRCLPLGALVQMVNTYAKRQWAETERRLPRGTAILYVSEGAEGVFFEVNEPIVTAYVEAKQCSKGVVDEGLKFEDFKVEHFIDTFNYALDCEGQDDISFDLSDWGKEMVLPSYEQIEKLVTRLREGAQNAAAPTHAAV